MESKTRIKASKAKKSTGMKRARVNIVNVRASDSLTNARAGKEEGKQGTKKRTHENDDDLEKGWEKVRSKRAKMKVLPSILKHIKETGPT